MAWVVGFREVGAADVGEVGGKNASLGEMLRELTSLGVRVPDGFAVTASAYRAFLRQNGLEGPIARILAGARPIAVPELERRSAAIRELILRAELPREVADAIATSYRALGGSAGDSSPSPGSAGEGWGEGSIHVAVRSSATAEDLPTASFAGQQESYLHVRGERELLEKVKRCYASLFTPRAISYREDMGFDHDAVALSVGVQRMVRADTSASGVAFTLEPESGHRDIAYVTSAFGLGENVVQGRVDPDAFWVHKPTLATGHRSLVRRKIGRKELRLAYDPVRLELVNQPVPDAERARASITDDEALELARWSVTIERHYSRLRGVATPMDIEWAKDGISGELFIVQARPETVHSQRIGPTMRVHHLLEQGQVLVHGQAVGDQISAGKARVIRDPRHMRAFEKGEVLVTESTDPDWEPILKLASAVVTEQGGRTSHAAIVARELGIPAVVGAAGACERVASGDLVTVVCSEGEVGTVRPGRLGFEVEEIDLSTLGRPRTKLMLNVGDPERAFGLARLPCDGVGLARMEFVFASWVKVHPLALTRYDQLPDATKRDVDALVAGYPSRTEYLVDRLAQGIGTLAAAFWPRPVTLRFSDFKTNEYSHLLGGAGFEPTEPNPMLGWRGASRYYHPGYEDGFLLECAAVKRVRETFGLTNLRVMVPFCRTPEEGRRTLAVMAEGGLVRGQDGLEVWVMAEIPSNVILTEQFAAIFDGFSIGSNDLTQLTLGVDRDSSQVAPLFDERDEAVKSLIADLIARAHRVGTPVGICGQAPSDHPDFARFLVERGIDSISLTADAIVRATREVLAAEQASKGAPVGAGR
jgi:pyruvate,water dikinase